MAYTEENVFTDCAKNKKQLVRAEERVYKAVWLALCKWIVEQFDKGRGINISTLMQLTWMPDMAEGEMYGSTGDSTVLRPIWRMSEGFEKAHGLSNRNKSDNRKPEDGIMFIKSEEINFHKIAIRHSNNLSHDQCFSSLRDMFKRIGQVMSEGKEVKIFFGVGDLCSSDRKVLFAFDGHYSRYVKRATDTCASASEVDVGEGSRGQSRRSERLVIDHDRDLDDEGKEGNDSFRSQDGYEGGQGDVSRYRQTRPSTSSSAHVHGFFQGVPNDDSWKTQKVRDRLQVIRNVNEKLWRLQDAELVKTVNFETRNMLLGEQRRVAGEIEEEEKYEIERRRRYEHARAQRDEVRMREMNKKKKLFDARNADQEDPFYVHLEPDKTLVETKKKQAQEVFRSGLEEQIAQRIKTAQVEKLNVLKTEQELLEKGHKMLQRSLIHEDTVKLQRDILLKNDWAQQIKAKERSRKLSATINRCLTEPVGTPLGFDQVMKGATSRPSTSMSIRSQSLRMPSRLSTAARLSLSRSGAR